MSGRISVPMRDEGDGRSSGHGSSSDSERDVFEIEPADKPSSRGSHRTGTKPSSRGSTAMTEDAVVPVVRRRASAVMSGWFQGGFQPQNKPTSQLTGTGLKAVLAQKRAALAQKQSAFTRATSGGTSRAETPGSDKTGTASSARSRLRESRLGTGATGASRSKKPTTAQTYDSYASVDDLEKDNSLLEGPYSEIIEEYGLTAEGILQFEVLGLPKEQIRKLRSLFLSLDKDGGGELSAVELYDALRAFGQNINDEEVRKMMEEIDQDNSGTIGYEEFLLVTIPGTTTSSSRKKRQ
eukprot:3492151-Rhodomonas_salina.1